METEQLTFTRFIAALSIVIYHFGDTFFPFNIRLLAPIFKHANLGVSYFFILSGFVMIIAYGKENKEVEPGKYLKNRAARILPLYYFAMVCMLVYYLIRTNILNISSDYLPSYMDGLLNLFLIQSWIPAKATTLNTPAWSLSVEMLFYLIFPILFNKFYKKFAFRKIVIWTILFFTLSQIAFHWLVYNFRDITSYFFYHPLLHVNEFIIGNLFGIIFLRNASQRKNRTIPIVIFCLLIIILLFFPIKGLIYHNGLYSLLFAPLIYYIAEDNGIITRYIRKKTFQFLGEVSYGVYLLQFPVFLFFYCYINIFGL